MKPPFRLHKRAGMLVITAGLTVAAFPWLKAARYEYDKRELLRQWVSDTDETATITERPGQPYIRETDTLSAPAAATDLPQAEALSLLKGMIGIIRIDKINFSSPILDSINDENLNLGICVVDGSPEMGGEGNYCLAGHRSRVSGRHFNRLDELAAGDTVTLEDKQCSYIFTVTDVFLVTAEDNWVMADTPSKTELTLITCDYTTEETGRLIVRCELSSPY